MRVNPALPATIALGLRLETVGADVGVIVKVAGLDVPLVVVTVMLAEPGAAISTAGTMAVHCVVPTYVVVRPVEFHVTWQDESKTVPLTVNVNCAPPAVAEGGDRLLIVGVVDPALVKARIPAAVAVMVLLPPPEWIVTLPEAIPTLY